MINPTDRIEKNKNVAKQTEKEIRDRAVKWKKELEVKEDNLISELESVRSDLSRIGFILDPANVLLSPLDIPADRIEKNKNVAKQTEKHGDRDRAVKWKKELEVKEDNLISELESVRLDLARIGFILDREKNNDKV